MEVIWAYFVWFSKLLASLTLQLSRSWIEWSNSEAKQRFPFVENQCFSKSQVSGSVPLAPLKEFNDSIWFNFSKVINSISEVNECIDLSSLQANLTIN